MKKAELVAALADPAGFSVFSNSHPMRIPTAQLFLLDKSTTPWSLLLGMHGDSGIFPQRMTGLCADAFEDGVFDPEGALVKAAEEHGVFIQKDQLERRAVFEFIEQDQPGVVNEDWICYAEIKSSAQSSLPDPESAAAERSWTPEWVPIDAIPYHKMPVDDAVWYPPFLNAKSLAGRFAFDGEVLTGCSMWELDPEEIGRLATGSH
jgi:hypothetical protein